MNIIDEKMLNPAVSPSGAIRAARGIDEINKKFDAMSEKLNQLTNALESERQLRIKSDKRMEKIAMYTLIANGMATVIALLSFVIALFSFYH